jgi:hypothetical protein
MNGLEYATVPRRRHASTSPEQASKERGVLVPDRKADLINGLVGRFEQAFGLFDTEVLHVVDESKARGLLEASFQGALRHSCMPDHARHHARLAEVLAKPLLAAAHHRIRMWLLAHE